METKLAYSVEEAAEQLGVGRTSVFGLMRSGQLRSVKIGARRLIPRTVLEEYVTRLLDEAS